MKEVLKILLLLVAYHFFAYPIKEYFGRGSIGALIFTFILFIVLYKRLSSRKNDSKINKIELEKENEKI